MINTLFAKERAPLAFKIRSDKILPAPCFIGAIYDRLR